MHKKSNKTSYETIMVLLLILLICFIIAASGSKKFKHRHTYESKFSFEKILLSTIIGVILITLYHIIKNSKETPDLGFLLLLTFLGIPVILLLWKYLIYEDKNVQKMIHDFNCFMN